MKTKKPHIGDWKFHFRNSFVPIHAHYGDPPKDITEEIIAFIETLLQQAIEEGKRASIKELAKEWHKAQQMKPLKITPKK